MKDHSKEEIKNMFYAYHRSVGLDEFIEFVSENFYNLQSKITQLEESKASKSDLKRFIEKALK